MFNSINVRPSGIAKCAPLLTGAIIAGFMSVVSVLVTLVGAIGVVYCFGAIIFELVGLATYQTDPSEARQVLLIAGIAGVVCFLIGLGMTLAARRAFDLCAKLLEEHVTDTETIAVIVGFFGSIIVANLFFGKPFTSTDWHLIFFASGIL